MPKASNHEIPRKLGMTFKVRDDIPTHARSSSSSGSVGVSAGRRCGRSRLSLALDDGAAPDDSNASIFFCSGVARSRTASLLGSGPIADRLHLEEHVLDLRRQAQHIMVSQPEGLTSRVVWSTEAQHARLVARPDRLARSWPTELDIAVAACVTPDARGVATQLTRGGAITADVDVRQPFELGTPNVAIHERWVVADAQLRCRRGELDDLGQDVDVIAMRAQVQRGQCLGLRGCAWSRAMSTPPYQPARDEQPRNYEERRQHGRGNRHRVDCCTQPIRTWRCPR